MASVRRNFAYQSVYQITTIILPLVTSPYVARVLGAEGIGVYSYTYAIAYYFSLVALLGISNHGNRVIAGARDDIVHLKKIFSNLLMVHCTIAGIATIAYYAYCFLCIRDNSLCAAIQGLWVVSSLFDVSWLFFGLEKFKLTVVRSTLIKILTTVCVFIFVKNSTDTWKYCAIMAGGMLISQLVLWPFIKKYFDIKVVSWEESKKHIKPLCVLFIPAIAISLYKYMDKIMLGIMTTKTQVGFFENAERAINIPISIIGAFGTVMLPKMSNLIARDNDNEAKRYIMLSVEFIMCLTVAMSLGMASVAKDFSVLFWGKDFSECGMLIKILAISVIFVAFANILRMQYLIPKKMDNVYIASVFTGAVVNIVINGLLISRLYAVGAAIGTVAAEFSVCAVQAYCLRKELPILTYIHKILPFMVFGIVMYLMLTLIENLKLPIAVILLSQIIVGGIFYSVCCFVFFKKTNNKYFDSIINDIVAKFKER